MITTVDKVLKDVAAKHGIKVYLGLANELEDCIVYKPNPSFANGTRKELTVEIRVITFEPELGAEILDSIDQAFFGEGDNVVIPEASSVEQNGGGFIFNEDSNTTHFFKNINIVY